MPPTTRAFVKASFLYLAIGAVLGSILLIHRWVPLGPGVAALKVSHVDMVLVGWLTQLILGVAWWLFPPLKTGLRPDEPKPILRGQAQRGSEPLFWATFFFLNAGVLFRALGEPLFVWTQVAVFRALAGVSGFFVLAAAVSFVLNTWQRVRELGRG
jgi:hypothetical protein